MKDEAKTRVTLRTSHNNETKNWYNSVILQCTTP